VIKHSLGLAPGHHLWSYGIREIKVKDNTSLKLISLWFCVMVICKWFEGSASAELGFCNICRDYGIKLNEIDPYL
jgi:hypothetical protein